MDENELISYVMNLLGQIKLYHWATTSYAKHKALDELHSALSDKTDLLVESYIGKFKKQPLKTFTVHTMATSDTKGIEPFLEAERNTMEKLCKKFAKFPEFENILQEMMVEVDKTLYLCRLQ